MEQSVEVNQQKRDIVTEDKNKADNADSKDQKEEEQIPPKKVTQDTSRSASNA